jgi:hypothetical protein
MSTIPDWHLVGDWFDICSCNIPCPCEFAQAPTNNACQGMLAWHIREGRYGTLQLDGLNLLALGAFEGNLWLDEGVKARMGFFIDERADAQQREALQIIFTGQAGGWPAGFARKIGETRGVEFVPITFEVADDLAFWRAEIPNRVVAYKLLEKDQYTHKHNHEIRELYLSSSRPPTRSRISRSRVISRSA